MEPRDASRMLVLYRAEGRWEHRMFREFPTFLRRGDVLVTNNTKVIPARLAARKPGTGGRVELFLLEEKSPGTWDVLMRARRRPKPGEQVVLPTPGGDVVVTLLADGELGRATVRFETNRPVLALADEAGDIPLPPYIRREHGSEAGDLAGYQTVFARHAGAVAAPTAGLHFTPSILETIAARGVERTEVTLHVGIGTFRPVNAEEVTEHRMEEERYEVTAEASEKIRAARAAGGRCVAVGSTSVRTLESVMARHGELRADAGRTDLFIFPPYPFRAVEVMLTNFHLPKSTLLMMMSAFAGRDLVLAAYADAVIERYRFFSYGDCMLIA